MRSGVKVLKRRGVIVVKKRGVVAMKKSGEKDGYQDHTISGRNGLKIEKLLVYE